MELIDKTVDNTTPMNVVATALDLKKRATEYRERAIKELLSQRQKIDEDLKALEYVPEPQQPIAFSRQHSNGFNGIHDGNGHKPTSSKRFKDLSLAEISKTLLAEHGELHGSQIEKYAKAGGFQSKTENLQNYLPVALKRAGGFRNVGKNTWILDASVRPLGEQ